MEDLILMARAAKKRLKTNFWDERKKSLDDDASEAKLKGMNELQIKSRLADKVKSEVRGEKQDEFYLKVKLLLDTEGEVSDAIGRLTDKEVYEKLSYEEKQRYNLELSARYLSALKKYKKEKELGL